MDSPKDLPPCANCGYTATPYAAADNLRNNQRQLDMDGCEVGVSRQALDEVLAELERLRIENQHLRAEVYE